MGKRFLVVLLILCTITNLGLSQASFEFIPGSEHPSNQHLTDINNSTEPMGQWGVLERTFALDTTHTTISIELSPLNPLQFTKDISYYSENGAVAWRGISQNLTCQGCELYITESSGKIDASIFTSTGIIGISDIGDSYYIFYDKSSNNSDCDFHDFPDISLESTAPNSIPSSIPNNGATSRHVCSGLETFSMIIAYTPEFANTFSVTNRQSEINEFLYDVIEATNDSYEDSNLNIRVRLAFSYQTPDSEYGNKGDDFDSFVNPVKKKFFGGTKWGRYDEIFGYRTEYNADVAILLVSPNIGGRASRNLNMGIYAKAGAISRYGVAHEIGHMFNLDHNIEEYSFIEKLFLSGKKAYGYRNSDHATVMSYTDGHTRVGLYSNPGYFFPGTTALAGNDKAKARNYINGHLNKVIRKYDYQNHVINDETIESTQTLDEFAISTITTTDFVVEPNAWVTLKAEDFIILEPGTEIKAGAFATLSITDCSDISGSVAAESSLSNANLENLENDPSDLKQDGATVFTIYPNPTDENWINVLYEAEEKSDYEIVIYDLSGSLLETKLYKNTRKIEDRIDISHIRSGAYMMNICADNGDCLIQKFIIR